MLQKIKKIGIVALVVSFLTGATYIVFNLYSKILIQKYLEKSLNERCKISGYHFNIFGNLNFKELKLGDALLVKNFTLKYNPFSLIFLRTISYIHAEEFTIYPYKLKGTGNKKSPSFTTTLTIPVQFEEIRIKKGIIVLDTTKIELNFIYLTGEGTGKPYRIRSYINEIYFEDENFYFYSDILIKNNTILIKDMEIQNNKLGISGTFGAIYLPDSARLKISLIKLQQNSAKELNLLYLINNGKLFLNAREINVQGQTFKDVFAVMDQEFPDSLIIEKVLFKYRENTINGNGVYLIKEGKLSIGALDISLNEAGLTGYITSSLEFEKGKLFGKFSSSNLKYLNSEDFQINCKFSFYDSKLNINLDNITSTNSNLSGKVVFTDNKAKIVANGVLSLSDLLKDLGGIAHFNINYTLGRDYREGYAIFKAKALNYEKTSAKEILLTISSKGQIDSLKIFGKELMASNLQADSTITLLVSDELKHFYITLSAFQNCSSLKGNFFFSNLGGKNFDFQVTNLQFLVGKTDTFEITDPINVVKRYNKVSIDSGKIWVNSSPVLLKANLDLSTKEIDAQFLINTLKINNLAGISSILSGSLYISGTLETPKANAWIQAENLNFREYKDLKLCVFAKIYENGVILDTVSILGPSTDVELNGFFPLTFSLLPFNFKPENQGKYEIEARIRDLPAEKINNFTDKQLILNSLNIYGEVKIYGTYGSQPYLSGFLRSENMSGIYTPIQLEFSKGEIFTELEGDGFKIKRGTALVDHGTVKIYGHGKKLFEKKREIFLTFSGTNVTLYPSYNLFASGDTKIDVLIREDGIIVKGDALIKEATIFQSIRPPKESHSQFPQNLNLLLNLHLEGNTFLVNELADIEIKGNLVYQIMGGKMLLDGTVDVVKGYFLYLDRIFDIQSGYVNFNSSEDLEPEFNLKAFSKVDTFNVYLTLAGTMRNPQITLTSEPPLDELNIIYLLTLGKPYGDTTSSGIEELQELKNRAFTLASTLISQSLRRTLRFQELRLSSSETTENPALLIGFYLNPRFYLWYSHDIFDITKDMFRIRYKVNNNFGIFAERDQEHRLFIGLDYIYEF
ncbi:MAG: translocation/assembly module TamB domain-containing protein [bacterium]|nr:translocation/assembly module TamB domain-containing protein [bacterium]